jgi:hypothetical protein
VTLDALVALAMQLAAGPAAGTWFTPRQARCAGSAPRMEAGPTWAYAWQEAGRLAGYGVVPDARLRLCGPVRAWPASGCEAPAVLGQFSGHAAVRDLAWRNGLALYAVMDWAARLIQDGVCTLSDPPGTPVPDGGTPPPGPAGHPAAAHGQAPPLPHRTAGNAPGGAGIPQSADLRWTPPDPDLLRRLLAGLKRLG